MCKIFPVTGNLYFWNRTLDGMNGKRSLILCQLFECVKQSWTRGNFHQKSFWGYRVEIFGSEQPSRAALQTVTLTYFSRDALTLAGGSKPRSETGLWKAAKNLKVHPCESALQPCHGWIYWGLTACEHKSHIKTNGVKYSIKMTQRIFKEKFNHLFVILHM